MYCFCILTLSDIFSPIQKFLYIQLIKKLINKTFDMDKSGNKRFNTNSLINAPFYIQIHQLNANLTR